MLRFPDIRRQPHSGVRPRVVCDQRGDTSIRVLVMTAAVSAVLKLVSPHFAAVSDLEVVNRGVESLLMTARLRAISEDRCIRVSFDGAAGTYRIASKRTTTPCGAAGYANEGPARPIDKNGRIRVEASDDPVFDTWGNAPTPAKVKLATANGTSRMIAVSPEGRVNGR